MLSPSEWASFRGGGEAERSALEGSSVYFPYFSVGTVFDEAATRARLEPLGLVASPLGDYLERLLDFATRSRWGKRPIARNAAAGSRGGRAGAAGVRVPRRPLRDACLRRARIETAPAPAATVSLPDGRASRAPPPNRGVVHAPVLPTTLDRFMLDS